MTLTADRRVELLAKAGLFADVDADGMARIAARAVEVDFPADHVIARQGEIGTGFFVVVTGVGWVGRLSTLPRTVTPSVEKLDRRTLSPVKAAPSAMAA